MVPWVFSPGRVDKKIFSRKEEESMPHKISILGFARSLRKFDFLIVGRPGIQLSG
jgi:hypothetical protein